MKPLLIIVGALLVLAHPAAVADACHVLLIAELAVLAVIAAGIARSAGLRRYWRARRFTPWVP